MHIISPNIINLFKNKQYLIILQGCRGSGKTVFSLELKKLHPNIEICSVDDFFDNSPKNIEHTRQNLIDAYHFCKQKIKNFLREGKTVIYNNINLNDSQLDDIITETKSQKISCILLRFLPIWDEETCSFFARRFHPITQQNITKQNIIRDNINLIQFQNKHKLPCFGIQPSLIPNLNLKGNISQNSNSDIFFFKPYSPNIENLKQRYFKAGYIQEKQKIPNTPKNKILQASENPPFMELPPAVQLELITQNNKITSLQKQIEDLQKQLAELSFNHNYKKETFHHAKRQRIENDEHHFDYDD
jgi:hypothetical protein